MSTNVLMPQMGESVAEGTIVRWIKRVGDLIDKDEPLVRDLDRQSRCRDPIARCRRAARDPRQRGRNRPRQQRRGGHRRGWGETSVDPTVRRCDGTTGSRNELTPSPSSVLGYAYPRVEKDDQRSSRPARLSHLSHRRIVFARSLPPSCARLLGLTGSTSVDCRALAFPGA